MTPLVAQQSWLPAGSEFLPVALDCALKATILLCVSAGLVLLLRRASAAVRHYVSLLSLGSLLALPLLTFALPGWRVPVLPIQLDSGSPSAPESFVAAAGMHRIAAPRGAEAESTGPPAPFTLSHRLHPGSRAATTPPAKPSTDAANAANAVAAPSDAVAAQASVDLVLLAWLSGAVITLAPLAVGAHRTRRLRRRSRRLDGPFWNRMLESLKARLAVRRSVALLEAHQRLMPMTWGVFRPVIALPAEAGQWPADRQRTVLLHELAHVKRWDVALQFIARLACALYWFHPLVWHLARRMRLERERACDDCVLAAGEKASTYAAELLNMARTHRALPLAAGIAMARPTQLEGRLLAVLDPARRRGPVGRRLGRLLLVGMLLLATAIAVIRPLPQARAQTVGADGLSQEVPAVGHTRSPAADESRSQNRALDAGRTNRDGEPLPEGADLRLGTIRFRQQRGALGVAFAPDGKALATSGYEDVVRLWDVASGKLLREFVTPEGIWNTFGLAFSPDGTKLAGSCSNSGVVLWDVASGRPLLELSHERGFTYGVAFAPDGDSFATAASNGSVRVWKTADGTELHRFETGERVFDAFGIAISRDGQRLAAGGNQTIYLWDLESGEELRRINDAHGRTCVSLAFTPDGEALISAGQGKPIAGSEIRMWNVRNGHRLRDFKTEKPTGADCSAVLSRDGSVLVSMHRDELRIWDVATGTLIRTIGEDRSMSAGRTHGLALSPDGGTVAAIGRGSKADLWDVASGEPLHAQADAHSDRILCAAATADGQFLATGSQDGSVRLWDARTGRHVRKLVQGAGGAYSVAFWPDGTKLLAVAERYDSQRHAIHGEMSVVNVGSGKVLRHVRLDDRGRRGCVSPDGRMFAVARGLGEEFHGGPPGENVSSGCPIDVWNVETGKRLTLPIRHEKQILGLSFSPDGQKLISVSEDNTIRHWNPFEAQEPQRIPIAGHQRDDAEWKGRPARLLFAGFSADARTVVTSGLFSDTLRVWETATGNERTSIRVPGSHGGPVAMSPDGGVVAYGWMTAPDTWPDIRNTIRLFDVATGRKLREFDLARSIIGSLAFSPDGKRLISGTEFGTALVWDLTDI